MMPSVDLLPSYDQHLRVVDKWIWDGRHYERTANAWVAEMDRNRSKILAVFEKLYGPSQAKIWFQRWRMLFMAGAELFGYREGSEWFVAHYRFEKKT
jgi:cyclopropane-fatty-acyl-phospholipid synthase